MEGRQGENAEEVYMEGRQGENYRSSDDGEIILYFLIIVSCKHNDSVRMFCSIN